MATPDLRKADRILEQLLDLPPSERQASLESSCDGDPALQALVSRLLGQATGEDENLSPGAGLQLFGVETRDFRIRGADGPKIGDSVGDFRLVEVLGRGGMATVYLAKRDDGQFEQQVALKVLDRVGETEARFAQERQILASLNHPNIARLVSGGVTDAGVPYVVIEYIEGEPLLDYCDSRRLDVETRLELFLPIVDAVHSAHRQLIVHRDIKSSNILVTDQGVPKLLDFGIAKLLEPDALPHAAPATRAVVPLTPEYASPEQIRGETMSVATDIYQLGHLLYTLLVGESPHAIDTKDVVALVDAIVNREPIPPSLRAARLARAKDGSDKLANRATQPAKLSRVLAGDLDRVILKALHKDPDHRYASASQLAADIRNVLADRPIIARPDSVAYRSGKFIRRHRAGVAIASIVLIGAVAATTVFTYRLAEEKDKAMLEAEKAREVSDFLVGLVELSEPERAQGRDVTVREVLDRAAARVEHELDGQPQVQGTLQSVIGQMYRELGAYERAEALLDGAFATQTALAGGNDPDIADIHLQRAELYLYQGRYGDAVTESDVALALLDDDDAYSAEAIVEALRLRGRALRMNGELDSARESLLQARRLFTSAALSNTRLAALIDFELGNVELDASKFDEARANFLHAVDVLQPDAAPPNLDVARAHLRLSFIALELNDFEEAERRAQSSLDIVRRIHGTDHPDQLAPMGVLSSVHSDRGNYEESEKLLEQQLRVARASLGENHPETAVVLNNLGTLRFRQDRYDEAAGFYRQAVEVRNLALGPEHPITGMTISFEGYARYLAGDPAAEDLYRQALAILEAAYEPGHRYVANVHHDLGRMYVDAGRYKDAESLLRTALHARIDVFGEGNVRVAASKLYLGACLAGLGRLEEAKPLLRESRAWAVDAHGEDSLQVAHADLWIADWLTRAGQHREARATFVNASSRIREERTDGHWLVRLSARLEPRM